MSKEIDLYSVAFPNAPNPWKVAIVLELLGLKYNIILVDLFSIKKPPLIDINPNGRTPVIVDHNNDALVLWESVAIVKYLIDRYDVDSKFTYTSGPEKYYIDQWLLFQASGQGPYFGQAVFFSQVHPEKLPSAISRYRQEIRRVLGVLEIALKDREYLVGDKLTIADLSFVPWHHIIPYACLEQTDEIKKGFPNVDKWMAKMMELPAVKTVLVDKRDQLCRPLPAVIRFALGLIRTVNGWKNWLIGRDQMVQEKIPEQED